MNLTSKNGTNAYLKIENQSGFWLYELTHTAALTLLDNKFIAKIAIVAS